MLTQLRSALVSLSLLSALLTLVPVYGQPKSPIDCSELLSGGSIERIIYNVESQAAAIILTRYGLHLDHITGEIHPVKLKSELARRIERHQQKLGIHFTAAFADAPKDSKQNSLATSSGRTVWIHPKTLHQNGDYPRFIEMVIEHEVEHTRQTLGRNASSLLNVNNWGPLNYLNRNGTGQFVEGNSYAQDFRFDELEARLASLQVFDPQSTGQIDAKDQAAFKQIFDDAVFFYNLEMDVLKEAEKVLAHIPEYEIGFENRGGIFNMILRIHRNDRASTVQVPFYDAPSDLFTKKDYLQKIFEKRHQELGNIFEKMRLYRR